MTVPHGTRAIAALIAELEAATEGSPEVDLAIGKAIGAIPEDAIWGDGSPHDDASTALRNRMAPLWGEWTTPGHNAYRQERMAFSRTSPSREAWTAWDAERPVPGIDDRSKPYWAGYAARYTTSLDAALTLVPKGWTAEINWRDAFDKSSSCVLHEFPEPCRRIPEKPYAIIARSCPLSICIAALKARLVT
jgi:hypothetical protein